MTQTPSRVYCVYVCHYSDFAVSVLSCSLSTAVTLALPTFVAFQYARLNLVMTKHTMRHTVLNWATLCENSHMPVQLPDQQTRNQFSLYQQT